MGRHAAYIVALGTDVASDIRSAQGTPHPTVVLLPWGDVFADFLDRLGVSFEELRDEFVGSWMFGYAAALATAGVRTVIVCPTSQRRPRPWRRCMPRPGRSFGSLPTSRAHAALRARRLDGRLDGRRDPRAVARRRRDTRRAVPRHPAAGASRSSSGTRAASALLCQEYEDPRFDVCVGRRAARRRARLRDVPGGRLPGQPARAPASSASRSARARARRGSATRARARASARTACPRESSRTSPNPIDVGDSGDRTTARRSARSSGSRRRPRSSRGTGRCSSGGRASTSCSTPGGG